MFCTRFVFLALTMTLLLTGAALAQLSKADITELQERGELEGWTFTVGDNPATQYSLDELCGLVEPPDWKVGARFDPMVVEALTHLEIWQGR